MKTKSFHRLIKMITFLTVVSLVFYCNRDSSTQPKIEPQKPEIYKILFIGSSYFNYNNLPEMLKDLAEAGVKKYSSIVQPKMGLILISTAPI